MVHSASPRSPATSRCSMFPRPSAESRRRRRTDTKARPVPERPRSPPGPAFIVPQRQPLFRGAGPLAQWRKARKIQARQGLKGAPRGEPFGARFGAGAGKGGNGRLRRWHPRLELRDGSVENLARRPQEAQGLAGWRANRKPLAGNDIYPPRLTRQRGLAGESGGPFGREAVRPSPWSDGTRLRSDETRRLPACLPRRLPRY